MKEGITLHQNVAEGFKNENSVSEKQNNQLLPSSAEFEARNEQSENKKDPFKEGAELMQRIWGDNFLSDSLY